MADPGAGLSRLSPLLGLESSASTTSLYAAGIGLTAYLGAGMLRFRSPRFHGERILSEGGGRFPAQVWPLNINRLSP